MKLLPSPPPPHSLHEIAATGAAVYDVSHLLPQPHPTTFNPTLSHNMYCHLTTNTPSNTTTITIPHHTDTFFFFRLQKIFHFFFHNGVGVPIMAITDHWAYDKAPPPSRGAATG